MSHNTRDYARMMRKKGHRVTPQRVHVLDAVCACGRHCTLDEVQARLREMDPGISSATLYRTLSFLQEVRLVVAAQRADGRTVYEIAGSEPHHHLVCTRCGGEQQIGAQEVAGLFAEIEARYGFRPETDHLRLTGLCAACLNDEA